MLLSWLTVLGAGMVVLHFVQKLLFPYFWDDFLFLVKVVLVIIRLKKYEKRGELVTVLDKFLSHAKRQPRKPFIIYEGDIYTYQDVDKRSSRVAHVFLNHSSLKKGDTVALLMSNEPDFVHVWFGLAKLGCVVAFLNSNIRSNSLLNCIRACGPTALVVGADLLGTVEEILPSLSENISVWGMKDSVPQGIISLKEKLSTSSDEPVPRSRHVVSLLKSTCLYIFTSGTTGLPKAAVISQLQALRGSAVLWAFGCTADDIVYITLPLYHSSAAILGISGCVELGATCVLKKKFSASQFWNDCKKYDVTVFQYIGELCRYLCKQSTLLSTFDLIKYDFQKDEPMRNEQGWCIHVKKGEPGLLISRVHAKNPFFGYAGPYKHTKDKLLCDVFKKGDVYLNTGDLIVQDQDNFLYFWDRTGDTFRWKGENVSTTEVVDVIGILDFIQETNVYGVAISGYEGRAGMASIILKPNKSLDLEKVYEQVVTSLPAYACPRFLRIQEKMEATGTFKLLKYRLVEEGFNPLKISEPLYFMDNLKKSYVPLTRELYDQIMLGEIKL
ncbi:long-chain fatty acid transport protein 6 isoform X2 [Macaca thibetana thibetana]|uniref:long-chain fatty acid transport protein 6 isoform X2 n=1 Tax=Macaca thibetana thibetana TaxID=257877 RepID=UPI0021BC366F|nr:long-chain fatty acid transport protein 6 isoform X2 [Macaca thibetana thibetana]